MRLARTEEVSLTQQRACREPMVAGGGCFAVRAGSGFMCKLWKQVAALQHPRQDSLGYAAGKLLTFMHGLAPMLNMVSTSNYREQLVQIMVVRCSHHGGSTQTLVRMHNTNMFCS